MAPQETAGGENFSPAEVIALCALRCEEPQQCL